jgi:hypothetical protein
MKKQGIIFALVALALALGAWWLIRLERPSAAKAPASGAPVERGALPGPGSEKKAVTVTNPPPQIVPGSNPPKGQNAGILASLKGDVDPAKRAAVLAALDDLKKQYGYAGALSWDEAKALIARREHVFRALLDQLAGLGPGGARAMGALYAETGDMRGKLLLIDALGKIQDGEAVGILQTLLGSETSLSLQLEMVAALGQQPDAASVGVLAGILQSQADPPLRFAAAQALNGRADALPALAQLIQTETDPNVQKELIQSAGAIGNNAALQMVAGIAQGTLALDARETAIQTLGRDFGAGALNTLKQLLGDPDVAIRQNVLTALAAMHSDDAVSLLQKAAASDSSTQVREQAQAILSALPVH